MRESDIVRTVRIKHVSEGAEKAKSDMQGLATAQDQLAKSSERLGTATETSARRQASVLSSFERLEQRASPAAKALADLERAERLVGRAVDQNAELQARGVAVLQVYRDRLAAAGAAHGEFAKSSGLAKHELQNLSYQVNDFFTQIASGQSPFRAIAQQFGQVYQVLANSKGTIAGFAGQVVESFTAGAGAALRFATSTVGVVAGLAAVGVAALAMASSWSSAQREIDKTLATPGGAASGMSRGGINRIAEEGSSALGLSVAEAREAATAFAATGKILEDNILRATKITKIFSTTMGVDVSEGAKKLATDLMTPSASAEEWAKKITGINADTINYIKTLENMGYKQEAIRALIDAATPGLQRQAEQVGVLANAYTFAANAVSDWWDRQKKNAASVGDFVTGGNMFGSRSDEEQLARLKDRLSNLQTSRTPGLDAAAVRQTTDDIAKLEAKMNDLRAATDGVRFDALSNEANALARSINKTDVQVESLTRSLQVLQQYQAERVDRGMGPDAGVSSAIDAAQQQLNVLTQQKQVVDGLRAAYGGVSEQTALALSNLEGQLNVASQITAAGRMKAQYEAQYNALLAQGVSQTEAQAIAAQQLAIAQAGANAAVQQQIDSLRQQNELLQARGPAERAAIEAAQAYNNALNSGADASKAGELAQEKGMNSLLQSEKAAGGVSQNLQQGAQNARNLAEEARKFQAALDYAQSHYVGGGGGAGALVSVVGARSPGYDYTEADAYIAAGGHRPDTVQSGRYGFNTNSRGDIMNQSGSFVVDPTNLTNSGINYYVGPEVFLKALEDMGREALRRQGYSPDYNSSADIAAANRIAKEAEADRLGGSAGERMRIQAQIDELKTQPKSLENNAKIAALTDSMNRVKDSLDANTDALQATLNPLYSEGHGALPQIGYFHAAGGLDMVAKGPTSGDQIPVHVKMNGEERLTVQTQAQQRAAAVSNDNSKTSYVNVNNYFGGGSSTSRRSQRQYGMTIGNITKAVS